MPPILISALISLVDDLFAGNNEKDKIKQAIHALQDKNAQDSFQSGWRPFIGWVCGAGLAWQFVLQPILGYALPMFGITPPQIVLDAYLWELLTAMLGLGSLRTFEKVKKIR